MGETEEELERVVKKHASKNEFKEKFCKSIFYGIPEEIQQRFEYLIELDFDYLQIMFPYGDDLKLSKDFAKLVMKKI